MFTTILALFIRIISNPLANVYQKKLSQTNSSLITNFYSYFILGLCCIPFAFNVNWNILSWQFWFYATTAGLLCSVGTACLIKALNMGELSVLGPINSYKAIVGMITAIVVVHEIPSFWGLLGVILIIWGSWFVFDTQKEGFSLALFKRKDIQLRFAALILTGIEAALLKKVIILSSVMISFMLWCWAGAFFAFLLLLLFKKSFKSISKPDIPKFAMVCLCLALMQITTNYVFEHIEVGFALALFQLSTIVNLVFGWKFFHETDIPKKIIGTVVMVLGAVIIIIT